VQPECARRDFWGTTIRFNNNAGNIGTRQHLNK
jgi:hypothetical protein